MSVKSQEPKIDNAGIDEQLLAYVRAHDMLQAEGHMTEFENTVVKQAGLVAAAMARHAIRNGKRGLTRKEVMALLDAAQTFAMILLGSADEAADRDTGYRRFYQHNVAPVIEQITKFEAAKLAELEAGHDPNCPDCRAELEAARKAGAVH